MFKKFVPEFNLKNSFERKWDVKRKSEYVVKQHVVF